MSSTSIRINEKQYTDVLILLEDMFNRDKELAPIALKFLKKIYSQSFGIKANRWQTYISELFKCQPIEEGEEKALEFICQKYSSHIEKVRGKKPYVLLIQKNNSGQIILTEQELEIIKKAVKWNASMSSYYSILKKIKGIGLIERKKGYFVKSNKFVNILQSMETVIQQLEDKEGTYVSK